eukprot:CAMPEP_0206063014 /NCGR_PEP_ID=MMETSP1466-20131121/58016_1 /ASSEMBLY_ACC=CAM_ASM_001126 /TAXON_ID=44452 /ORGANISM="Pavlova gyrans, Strain CCMP608" /LENGTH=355 /DNA_ID=CAMNT_0053438379 /DNA_START=220 /DNA_END=1284 /DNA_ORIENTATION=-
MTMRKEVCLAMHFLGSLESQDTIALSWGLRQSTQVSAIVNRFVDAVCSLDKHFIYFPEGEEMRAAADGFYEKGGLPRCVGAMDGTHVEIPKPPRHSGDFLYYKGKYTRILHAMVDSKGLFLSVNCGIPGSLGDNVALVESEIPTLLFEHAYPNGCYAIGDNIYPLRPLLLKSYDFTTADERQQAFNRCLDRARAPVENAFSRLKGRFRRLKYLRVAHGRQRRFMVACCVLHNVIERNEGPGEYKDDDPAFTRADGQDLIEPDITEDMPRADAAEREAKGMSERVAKHHRGVGKVSPRGKEILDGEYAPWRDLQGGEALRELVADIVYPEESERVARAVTAGLAYAEWYEREHGRP